MPGKVYSLDELQAVADFAIQHNLVRRFHCRFKHNVSKTAPQIVIADEVLESHFTSPVLCFFSSSQTFDRSKVYDVLLYDERQLIRLASLPGMAEVLSLLSLLSPHVFDLLARDRQRTISIGSAGKTFGVTGFKVGWMVLPPPLHSFVARVHQYVPFCVSSAVRVLLFRSRMKSS